MQQFFKDDENWRFCSLATDGSVVCFKMRTSHNTAYVLDMCVRARVRKIQDLQPNTIPTTRRDICLIHILRGVGWVEIGQSLVHFVSQV
jgi:hypothetical protein